MECPEVWARIAVLNGQTQAAEVVYLEQNQVEKAIQMCLSLYKWENGIIKEKQFPFERCYIYIYTYVHTFILLFDVKL